MRQTGGGVGHSKVEVVRDEESDSAEVEEDVEIECIEGDDYSDDESDNADGSDSEEECGAEDEDDELGPEDGEDDFDDEMEDYMW